MSKVGPGMSPNLQSATGRVQPTGHLKIFSAGGVKGSQPKAPILTKGNSSAGTGCPGREPKKLSR